jgi:hypothetical protein
VGGAAPEVLLRPKEREVADQFPRLVGVEPLLEPHDPERHAAELGLELGQDGVVAVHDEGRVVGREPAALGHLDHPLVGDDDAGTEGLVHVLDEPTLLDKGEHLLVLEVLVLRRSLAEGKAPEELKLLLVQGPRTGHDQPPLGMV